MAYFGWHVSTSGSWANMPLVAHDANADTFAFFPRPPRGGSMRALDMDDIDKLLERLHDFHFGPLVAHAPYVYNLAAQDESIRERSLNNMREDIDRLEIISAKHPVYYNFHPGAHTGQGRHIGINKIIDALNEVIKPHQKTIVLLETMAGKGTEIGSNFDELEQIIDGVTHDDRIGVCLDTCHTHDAGMSIATDFDSVLDEFEAVCGLSRLRAIHLNDSKNVCGSKKDRHERLGQGAIGLEAIKQIVCNPRVSDLPFILETPNDVDGYAVEIKLLHKMISDESIEELQSFLMDEQVISV